MIECDREVRTKRAMSAGWVAGCFWTMGMMLILVGAVTRLSALFPNVPRFAWPMVGVAFWFATYFFEGWMLPRLLRAWPK